MKPGLLFMLRYPLTCYKENFDLCETFLNCRIPPPLCISVKLPYVGMSHRPVRLQVPTRIYVFQMGSALRAVQKGRNIKAEFSLERK